MLLLEQHVIVIFNYSLIDSWVCWAIIRQVYIWYKVKNNSQPGAYNKDLLNLDKSKF